MVVVVLRRSSAIWSRPLTWQLCASASPRWSGSRCSPIRGRLRARLDRIRTRRAVGASVPGECGCGVCVDARRIARVACSTRNCRLRQLVGGRESAAGERHAVRDDEGGDPSLRRRPARRGEPARGRRALGVPGADRRSASGEPSSARAAFLPGRELLQPDDVARAVLDAIALPSTAEVTDLHIRPRRPPSSGPGVMFDPS